MQRFGKMLFETNGAYDQRERLPDQPCI
jgi:hypothetical protein